MEVIREMRGDEHLVLRHEEALAAHRAYIRENGADPKAISEWTWTASSR
jgi:phosphoketolase